MQALVDDALQLLRLNYKDAVIPEQSPMLFYDELFNCDKPVPAPGDLPLTNTGLTDLVVYFHSSGSTAFPKPIPITNRRFIEYTMSAHFAGQDLCGKVLGMQATPIFHSMGATHIAIAATTGMILSMYRPEFPAKTPSQENFMEAAQKTKCDYLLCVPTMLEVRYTLYCLLLTAR
jgi:acyl-coenzyme A synthetase/AMP-(fatty) acid ligase